MVILISVDCTAQIGVTCGTSCKVGRNFFSENLFTRDAGFKCCIIKLSKGVFITMTVKKLLAEIVEERQICHINAVKVESAYVNCHSQTVLWFLPDSAKSYEIKPRENLLCVLSPEMITSSSRGPLNDDAVWLLGLWSSRLSVEWKISRALHAMFSIYFLHLTVDPIHLELQRAHKFWSLFLVHTLCVFWLRFTVILGTLQLFLLVMTWMHYCRDIETLHNVCPS